MNKKQFFRLTIVVAIPFLILSLWLSQQDFVLNRGQYIHCDTRADVSGNYCYALTSLPKKDYEDVKKNRKLHFDYNAESTIYLSNFNYSISSGMYGDKYFLVTSNNLEKNGCSITYFRYNCGQAYGDFKFNNMEDYESFAKIIHSAGVELKKLDKIRYVVALVIF